MALLRRKKSEAVSFETALEGAELPSFPHVASGALEQLSNPDVDLKEVADLIVTDPGISASILRRVNSVGFGSRRSVDSVHQSVGLLGVSELEGLLISAGVRQALPERAVNGHDPRRFWAAAARRASIAGTMAARVLPSQRSQVFTAALLQDMAVPVLAAARADYAEIIDAWRQGHADLATLEFDRFGSDHATVASQMCQNWDFPTALSDAIGAHHDPHDEVERPAIVQLVSLIRDTDDPADVEALAETAAVSLHLEADVVAELIEQGEANAADLLATLT